MHAFPGMGADRRMYPLQWSTLPDLVVHEWPCYDGESSIADIATKLADVCEIRDGDSLVGTSLGGVVACEIAKIREIKTVYLIGSAKSKNEVNYFLSILHPLAEIAPISWIQVSAGKIPSDLTQMFAEVDASFIRAMCRAVFEWDGFDLPNTQVFRIHGRHDFIIPPPQKVDLLVDGGHLISMTHAKECVAAIINFQNETH